MQPRVQGASPRQELGLDKSTWEQYRLYVTGLLHGDLGTSLRTQKEVRDELVEPIKNTLPMIALGTLFAIVFGTITGVISAWRRDTAVDKAGLWTSLAFYSMPTQWLGLLMVLFVAGRARAADLGDRGPDSRASSGTPRPGTSSSTGCGT